MFQNRPQIRKVHDCTNEVKFKCIVSVNCNISTEMSRTAVQWLDRRQLKRTQVSLLRKRNNYQSIHLKGKKKEQKPVPTSQEQYKTYENVLRSSKAFSDFIQSMAIQTEKDAAAALHNKKDNVKCTLQYDSTQRSKIDGDRPCLILIFSDIQRFSLRALFFACEDRENIVRLIVETYTRLALSLSDIEVSAKDLWEKTTAIMTNSVSKNLKIEDGVGEQLKWNYEPTHLLCKSHLVETFDRANIDILSQVEKKLNFWEKLESINLSVKSFL